MALDDDTGRLRYAILLISLILCALLLSTRVVYLFLSDAHRFPINTVKIAGNYQHITRKQLESVLTHYLSESFFSLPVIKLNHDLVSLDWCKKVQIDRIWPDTLKITVIEKEPMAIWNGLVMTEDSHVISMNKEITDVALPHLSGPEHQQTEVLQNYQKLSKLLATYGLHAASLKLRENQAWDLSLTNGVLLRLGKRDLEKRLLRFCKAYSVAFADKPEQLSTVDLRYARGMAVQWKEVVKNKREDNG